MGTCGGENATSNQRRAGDQCSAPPQNTAPVRHFLGCSHPTSAAQLTECSVERRPGDPRLGSRGAEIDNGQIVGAQRIQLAGSSKEARRERVGNDVTGGRWFAAVSHKTLLLGEGEAMLVRCRLAERDTSRWFRVLAHTWAMIVRLTGY